MNDGVDAGHESKGSAIRVMAFHSDFHRRNKHSLKMSAGYLQIMIFWMPNRSNNKKTESERIMPCRTCWIIRGFCVRHKMKWHFVRIAIDIIIHKEREKKKEVHFHHNRNLNLFAIQFDFENSCRPPRRKARQLSTPKPPAVVLSLVLFCGRWEI